MRSHSWRVRSTHLIWDAARISFPVKFASLLASSTSNMAPWLMACGKTVTYFGCTPTQGPSM